MKYNKELILSAIKYHIENENIFIPKFRNWLKEYKCEFIQEEIRRKNG